MGIFCYLIIPKLGIKVQIFFLNGLWRFLKNRHLPVKLHSSAPQVIYDLLEDSGGMSSWQFIKEKLKLHIDSYLDVFDTVIKGEP